MAALSSTVHAQAPDVKKEDNIIIRKKGGADEKMTIVIDGDNITVNGKPLDQYKDSSLEIHRFKEGANFRGSRGLSKRFGPGAPPRPEAPGRLDAPDAPEAPAAPDAPEAFNHFRGPKRGFSKELRTFSPGNKALLGVVTEKDEKGAKITIVSPESPAVKAGLQKDDIIISINDTTISNSDDLTAFVGKHKPEDKVKVTYIRNGKKATATAVLAKRENRVQHFNWSNDNDDFAFDMPDMPELQEFFGGGDMQPFRGGRSFGFKEGMHKPHLGLQVQDTEEGKGVKVLHAAEESPAAKAGIQKEDVVTSVNGKDIQSVDDLKEQLKNVKEGDTVNIGYLHGKEVRTAQINFLKN
ncbi:HtrA protease/chaperone protein [Filimonas lacunae]|nr:HtrA protease/chaperone protein [Filimonas lacunae]